MELLQAESSNTISTPDKLKIKLDKKVAIKK